MKFLATGLLALSLSSASVLAAEKSWTRSEILAIADAKAKELGYDVEQMSVAFDFYNSHWHDYLRRATNFVPYPDIPAKLNDRKYWAVYYAPIKDQLGGDLSVFIDRETGETIDVIQGQ